MEPQVIEELNEKSDFLEDLKAWLKAVIIQELKVDLQTGEIQEK